jgi:hypothetical protein
MSPLVGRELAVCFLVFISITKTLLEQELAEN